MDNSIIPLPLFIDYSKENSPTFTMIQEIFSQRYGIMVRYLWVRIYDYQVATASFTTNRY